MREKPRVCYPPPPVGQQKKFEFSSMDDGGEMGRGVKLLVYIHNMQ
jgi:hypothetical protein